MNLETTPGTDGAARRLVEHVLAPMKSAFVGKDEIIDVLGVCLVGGENLFLMGPPGTAKSAIVQELARRIEGRAFDYLLTRFTEPNELFGPFDIRRLREGELVTNTEGMLPEASLVFLDELLNANSAVLNSLLMVLNERLFRRGRETRPVPILMAVGASNHLPDDEALGALFDRFLVRVPCRNVPQEQLHDVLHAGWELEGRRNAGEQQPAAEDGPSSMVHRPSHVHPEPATMDHGPRTMDHSVTVDDIRRLQDQVRAVDVTRVRPVYVELIQRLRHAGIAVSDRRAVKFQRLTAASALLCGRDAVEPSDMWVLRHTWDTEEQQEVLATLVGEALERHAAESPGPGHPRVAGDSAPDSEALARDLDRVGARLAEAHLSDADRSYLRDQLCVLAGRCEWVAGAEQRAFLKERAGKLQQQAGPSA